MKVENQTAYTQPQHYLEFLLEYLVCPVDNSMSLTAVRSPDGQITALKSEDREYQVIGNVPCMIPDCDRREKGYLTLWQELQRSIWRDYQGGHQDFVYFSAEDDPKERAVGEIIAQMAEGLLLDVGCGVTPLPGYMATSSGSISWVGVDPYFGDAARRFPFAQGLGEYLPFRAGVFDGVLYAGSIDHVTDPLRCLECTWSVMKPQGRLIIWNDLAWKDSRYIFWKAMQTLGLAWRYDGYHQWKFTRESLEALLKTAGFAIEQVVGLREPGDLLMVARVVGHI
jgi:SAM-dependent methyltransferase